MSNLQEAFDLLVALDGAELRTLNGKTGIVLNRGGKAYFLDEEEFDRELGERKLEDLTLGEVHESIKSASANYDIKKWGE